MCIQNTNDCGCNQTPCVTVPCSCDVLISSDCVNNVTEDLINSGIIKGQTLTEVLVQLDAYIQAKYNTTTSFFGIVNVGGGTELYKGISSIGKKEFRTLLDSGLININQGASTITISVDETALDTFVNERLKTYSAKNIGAVGVGLFKDVTISSLNTEFNFKKLKSSNSSVSIVEGSEDIDFTVEVADATAISQGSNVTITGTGTTLDPYIISATDTNTIADGSETKLSQGSNVTITGIGTTANPYVISSSGGAVADGSETKINQGANITITGVGTSVSPYIINSQYSPFERIDEGNGNGYVIRGRDAAFYGNIGADAIDLSYSTEVSSVNGATGSSSFAMGDHVIASNYLSTSFGYLVNNAGIGSFNTGFRLNDIGYTNFLTGIGHNVTSMNVTVVGQAANTIVEQILDFNATTTKALFVVGNGTIENGVGGDFNVLTRSDAFIVRMNGLATLPSVNNSLITADTTGKAVVTKEYLNLQKIITYPADFTGTNYTITDADMGYSIIIINGATAVTITIPSGLMPKMQVGLAQDGTADVTITPSGVTLKNAIGGYKIKGQYENVFLEQGATNIDYYLFGNTKI